MEELNRSFTAWVESVYHRTTHSETGQPPLERFHAAGPAPTPPLEAVLREAFLWSEKRTVSKTGTFGMHGNDYEVDAELARQQVELVFDPLDLTELEVRLAGRRVGIAVPLRIRRHVHPKARAEPDLERPAATGIDYLGLVAARRERELAAANRLPQPAAGQRRERRGEHAMSIDRLRAHWGFSKTPFTKELAPSMLFGSSSHQQAVARISWVVQERALGVVCGEVGAGKTVAARAATAGLDPSRHTLIYLPNPVIGARGLHAEIVRALGDTPRFHTAPLIAQAQEMLETEEAERGRRVVLVLDESHLLSSEQLEQLRMLTNSQMDSRATFACVLLGQPTLRRRLRQATFAALDQRIALRYSIDGMDLKETGDYVAHHLKLAGRSDTLFSDDAIGLIHEFSRGLPRQVNNLATQALIAAYVTNSSICDEKAARAALAELSE